MPARSLPRRGLAAALTAVLVLGGAPPARIAVVHAQPDCLAEAEPNDTLEEAPSVAGPLCITGELPDGDQDLTLWEIPATDAASRWTFRVEGIPGTLTSLKVFRVTSLPGEEPIAVDGAPWLDISSTPADPSPGVLTDVLLPVGRYLLGISRSTLPGGGAPDVEAYTWRVEPRSPWPASGDLEPNDDPSTAGAVSDAFEVGGDLAGSYDFYAWTVSQPDLRWDLTVLVPLGQPAWLEIVGGGGQMLAGVSAETRSDLFDLALAPGTYIIRVAPGAEEERPYILRAAPSEVEADPEPNDDAATATPIADGQPIRGRLAAVGDRDRFRLSVPRGDARLRDMRLIWRAELERSLCLLGADERESVCRSGTGGLALSDLLLAPGSHTIEVRGRRDPSDLYLLRVDTTSAAVPDFEAEPNDTPETGTPMDPALAMRARATGRDDDHFLLRVEGDPQLWQVDAAGTGIESLAWIRLDGRDLAQGEVDASGTSATLTDMYLVPGHHWLRVRARDGEYTLRATPLGPPDPDAEREPNSDEVRAEAYRIGERRVGRLATSTDRDLYRFTVAAPEHVVLRLAQPSDARTALALTTGDERIGEIRERAEGELIVWDLFLLPGDHLLELRPEQPSQGPYELTTERLDPFDPYGDQEPNDGPGFARAVPPSLSWHGSAVRPGDEDWYILPPLDRPAELRLHLDGGDARARLTGPDGLAIELVRQEDGGFLASEVPEGVALLLAITSRGDHTVRLESDGLSAADPPTELPVALSLEASEREVAAYWPDSQAVEAWLVITNTGPEQLDLELEGRTSHYLWSVGPASDRVTVPADGSVSLPLTVQVEPEAWAGEPVRISLRARTADGRQATTSTEMLASGEAPPVGAEPGWGVPPELLGGLNVAATALGAVPHGSLDAERELALYDGVTPSDGGFGTLPEQLPLELGVDLAGDDPLPVVGTIINPNARSGRLSERPRTFELLVSEDGETWTTALRGELSTLPIDQAFVLEGPVPARHARLRILDTYGDRTAYLALGEWKIIARPGVALSAAPFDIAATSRGGHVAIMEPFTTDRGLLARMLDEDRRREGLSPRKGESLDVVIGFQDARAAQVRSFAWRDPEDSDQTRRIGRVDIAVSLDSPLGPWRSVASWDLTRLADGSVAPLSLPAPVWARYVRLTGDLPADAYSVEMPATISVLERATDDEYRSILAEWGYASSRGPWEWLNPPLAVNLDEGQDAGDDQASATPLLPGVTVTDRASLGEDEDWYTITIPGGHNTLEVKLAGQPTVGVKLTLFDAAGTPRPMAFEAVDRANTRFQAAVEPAATYALRVDQPPFSAVFAFDTSGSMGPFLDFVLEGVRSFAAGVQPGRESVMLLPFEEPPIIDAWQDDPILLQSAVGAWAGSAGSSAAESGLIDASDQLAEREGARAILLVTDAETSSYQRTPELWRMLATVHPIIFSVHVGGASDPTFSRQLMQDWAASAGGHYAYPTTHGEMMRAFDRMATALRRPAIYSLLTTTSESILEPGSIAVRPPADGSRPGFAPGVGVEIILDTSGSMLEKLEGRRRIDIAREALARLVGEALADGVPVALRTFGGKGKGRAARCETRLTLPLAPLDKAATLDLIGKLKARKKTATPIGAALAAVADDLASVSGSRIVVLVTDGAETCNGDPAAAVAELREGGLDVNVNIVGFALDDEELKATMARWAASGGGTYFDAGGAESLTASIAAAVNAPFRVYGPSGEVITGGTVGGSAVALEPGAYRVEVLVDPPVSFPEVVVGSGATIELVLPAPGEEP